MPKKIMQLGNLDNEVIFKKAFSDKFVFKSFVKDVVAINKVQTQIISEFT